MSRYRPFIQAALCCVVLAVSIITLANQQQSRTQPLVPSSSEDQSRYAEVATTSGEMPAAMASSTMSINVPILVYHIVRPAYPDDSRAVRALALTPETFDAQMMYLARAGYHVISFAALEDYFKRHIALPEKPVILSFDDGWKDQFTYAFPLLVKNKYPATFFIFTNSIGRHGFISWEDLQIMQSAGMTIGSHSLSHPYLTRVATSTLWGEINDSKRILEQHLGVSVNEFAYPFGNYNPAIIAIVKKAGYRSARGDYESGEQSPDRLYQLSALNAPTTTALFEKKFPITGYVMRQAVGTILQTTTTSSE